MTNIETLESLTGQNQKPEGKLQYRETIPNTPLWLIGTPEKGYDIILGKWKLTTQPILKNINPENEDLIKLAHQHLNTLKWDYITKLAICIATDILQNKTN